MRFLTDHRFILHASRNLLCYEWLVPCENDTPLRRIKSKRHCIEHTFSPPCGRGMRGGGIWVQLFTPPLPAVGGVTNPSCKIPLVLCFLFQIRWGESTQGIFWCILTSMDSEKSLLTWPLTPALSSWAKTTGKPLHTFCTELTIVQDSSPWQVRWDRVRQRSCVHFSVSLMLIITARLWSSILLFHRPSFFRISIENSVFQITLQITQAF